MALHHEGFDAEMLVEPGVSTHTFDASSERIIFDSESMRRTTSMVDGTGIRGTRTRHYGRITAGNYSVAGDIVFRPGQTEINNWLPRILFGTESTDDFPFADDIPDASYFGVLIDKGGDIHQYNDCVVSRATFSASAGQALVVRLEIVGKTETLPSWPGSPPAVFAAAEDSLPILMSSGTLTLGGNTYYFEDFECVIDNMIDVQFRNSASAVALVPQDRMVTLRCNMDYQDTNVLYGAETAIAGTLDFVPVTDQHVTFTFPKLIAPKETPVVTGKTAIMNNITFTAYGDDYTDYTDNELYITNDLTGS